MIWFAWLVALVNQALTFAAEDPEPWWFALDALIWLWALVLTYISLTETGR